jgi:hypothetical protein
MIKLLSMLTLATLITLLASDAMAKRQLCTERVVRECVGVTCRLVVRCD